MQNLFDFNHIDPSISKETQEELKKTLQILPQTLVVPQENSGKTQKN